MNPNQFSDEFPFHLSVGAIVMNDKKEVALHHFEQVAGYNDIYYLMRSTVMPEESFDEAINRGLLEEMGVVATIKHFVGTRVTIFNDLEGNPIEKTTVYFLCDLVDWDENKRNNEHRESDSTVVWKSLDEAKEILKAQHERTSEKDLCEFDVLENF